MKKTSVLIALAMPLLCMNACKKDNQPFADEQSVTAASVNEMISENGNNPDEAVFTMASNEVGNGYIYTESNAAGQNTILVFKQMEDGTLAMQQEVASGGAGLGAGLGSQGALVLDAAKKWLFAVNAGDNTVSSFSVGADGKLTLKYTAASGGTTPNSVTVYGNILYVLNAGSSNICGFKVDAEGMLEKIEGSMHPLSDPAADAPQICFEPTGKALYVTEKATNKIGRFTLNAKGAVASAVFTPSTGETPFGFAYGRNKRYLIVSNAAGGVAGAGSCTSYGPGANGMLRAVNGAVPNYQGAPCWVATTKHGAFAYVTNTASNSISSYYINNMGKLYLVNAIAAIGGLATIDMVVSTDNRYAYAIGAASHTLEQFERKPFGQLKPIGSMPNLPEFAVGLAAY